MLDPEDCSLSLDSLFFEGPVVHKVKPLCQEASRWQLEPPPSNSQIPSTQDIQREAESLAYSNRGFSQTSKTFIPPLKRVDGSDKFTTRNTQFHNLDDEKEAGEEDRYSPWEVEQKSSRGSSETPQDSCSVLEMRSFPPLRRSLFNPPSGQVFNTKETVVSEDHTSQTRPRAQTSFLHRQVSMVTELQPVRQSAAVPRLLPGLGPSAAGGPLQPMQEKGTKKAHVLPMTPQPLNIQGSSGAGVLRPVSEIPAKFRSVFKEFPFFNYVQSKALDDVLYTSKNFVACAPTGSGKTVLFELAITRLLMETSEPWRNVKAVYMAPIKALCSQRYEDWKQKFGPLGLSCKELTGDTEIDDFFEIQDAHIIMTTPEKWDSMTRKWRDNCLLQLVRLFLIDEVHVVKDRTRGATLEVVVSRMKTVHAYRLSETPQADLSMRFVAVSATIPNISDIADWLCDAGGPATCLEMDESHRPVKLRKVVLGFPCSSNQTEFKFDLSLNYKMANIIQTYSDHKPTLVFCSTRKGVQQSATVLAKDARFIMSIEHKQRLMMYANSIQDSKLRDLVLVGVGYHHAGVDMSDRKCIEEAFTMGDLPVLFTTSTLAMGVNLPAHLVVIKSTMHYIGGSCEEYSEADMLQMIGRAGRPQFDSSATAVIMTKSQTKDKYMQLMNGAEIIESSLHGHLVEHLNAEIVLHTISDVHMALDWIRSTFLYVRALKNPKHYGFSSDLDRRGIEAQLQELCLKNLNLLASIDLVSMDEDINIKATEAGRLMARYCVAFDTMKEFSKVTGTETLPEMIELLAKGKEFSDVQLRVNEKRTLNTLNKDKNRITIRYSMEGKIKNSEMKVNCLIQAQLGSIPIQEFGLTQDTAKIFRNGIRITKCLAEFLKQRSRSGFSAIISALTLAKCLRAKLWENSPYVSKQLEKIGLTLSTALVNAGLTTFNKIEQTNARELELIVNRHPPFGNQIRESIIGLPKYEASLEQLPRYSATTAEIVVTVSLKNRDDLLSKRTAPDHHYVTLLIGDCDNNVVFLQNLPDLMLLKSGSWSKKIEVAKASKGEEISVNLISSEYVGLDIQQKFIAFYSGAKRFGAEPIDPPPSAGMQRALTSHQRAQDSGPRAQPPAPQGGASPQARAVSQGRNATSICETGKEPDLGKRQCNHFCKNKDLCGHDCCKVGVPRVLKRPVNPRGSFSSYLQDLKNRSDALAETPVKRLKMRMCGDSEPVKRQQFSYKPKPILPSVSRYHSTQSVETAEGFATTQELAYQESLDNEYCDYLEETYENVGVEKVVVPAIQTPALLQTYFCDPGVHFWSKPTVLNENRSYAERPSTASTNHSSFLSSLHTPNVNFDLGDEWDDWDDFDEENLVHASEVPCTAKTLAVDCSKSKGYSTTLPPIQAQLKPRFTMTPISTPLRPAEISMSVPPPPVRPHQQTSAPWDHHDKKAFSETTVNASSLPFSKPSDVKTGSSGGRFDFFSKKTDTIPNVKNVTGNDRTEVEDNREVEAFLGIFDGIF